MAKLRRPHGLTGVFHRRRRRYPICLEKQAGVNFHGDRD